VNTRTMIFALTGAALLGACADKDIILPGKREDLRSSTAADEVVNQERAIRVPSAKTNSSWTHRIGSPSYRVSNAALSQSPKLAWSAGIGEGDTRKGRLTADPVVAEGRIFTMDTAANLQATATNGGVLWTTNLTPSTDKISDAVGGGIAYGNGKLFVTTGFGRLVAVNPTSGKVLWEQKLEAIGSGTPTYYGGLVYVVSGDDKGWALNADTGKIAWQLFSIPAVNNVQSPAAPAVNDRLVVFPFGSGELQATFRRGGVRLWDAGIAGERLGRSINKVGDISGDPVIDGSVVYAANHSGRIVALDVDTGTRRWTAEEGALSPVWPSGGSIFLVSDRNQLVRLDAKDGSRIWAVDLPKFVSFKPKRQAALYAHYGPIMAGGKLRVASSDGLLRSFDPASGRLISTAEIPGGASSNPVVAGGVLYVVGGKGQLHAFR